MLNSKFCFWSKNENHSRVKLLMIQVWILTSFGTNHSRLIDSDIFYFEFEILTGNGNERKSVFFRDFRGVMKTAAWCSANVANWNGEWPLFMLKLCIIWTPMITKIVVFELIKLQFWEFETSKMLTSNHLLCF